MTKLDNKFCAFNYNNYILAFCIIIICIKYIFFEGESLHMSVTVTKDNIASELISPYLIYKYVTENPPTSETYDERKTWQKIGYLSQQLGLPLNEYTFRWYLAGPYSPAFTSVLYSINQEYDYICNSVNEFSLTNKAKNKLKPLKLLIQQKPEIISLSDWLELLASVLYIKKMYSLNKSGVFKKLLKAKPHYSNEKINLLAWELLEEVQLL